MIEVLTYIKYMSKYFQDHCGKYLWYAIRITGQKANEMGCKDLDNTGFFLNDTTGHNLIFGKYYLIKLNNFHNGRGFYVHPTAKIYEIT